MIMVFVCFFNQCQNAALDELFGNPKEVRLIRYNFIKYLLWHCIRQNHQGWIQSSGLQWNFFFGTPLFKGHKIWSRKSVHKVFVFITSFEETSLFRGKGHFFWAPTCIVFSKSLIAPNTTKTMQISILFHLKNTVQ